MKKRNIYQNQSQELLHLFELVGGGAKVMCVPMDYAKNDHLVMFCNGHGDILRKPFSVKNAPEGIDYPPLLPFFHSENDWLNILINSVDMSWICRLIER